MASAGGQIVRSSTSGVPSTCRELKATLPLWAIGSFIESQIAIKT